MLLLGRERRRRQEQRYRGVSSDCCSCVHGGYQTDPTTVFRRKAACFLVAAASAQRSAVDCLTMLLLSQCPAAAASAAAAATVQCRCSVKATVSSTCVRGQCTVSSASSGCVRRVVPTRPRCPPASLCLRLPIQRLPRSSHSPPRPSPTALVPTVHSPTQYRPAPSQHRPSTAVPTSTVVHRRTPRRQSSVWCPRHDTTTAAASATDTQAVTTARGRGTSAHQVGVYASKSRKNRGQR